MCSPYYYNDPSEENAAVVCQELGYEGAATTSRRHRDQRHEHLFWYDLYCCGNEDSVFNCDKCCADQFYEGDFCAYLPAYACQSKSNLWLAIHNAYALSSALCGPRA